MRYYRTETQTKTHPAIIRILLLAMIFILSTLPSLVLASDALPRYTLSPKEVGEKVAEAIEHIGIAEHVEATLKLEDHNTVFGSDTPMQVEVSALQADIPTKLWSANVLFKNGDKVMSALPMKGKFQPMVELPALIKPLTNGELIVAENVGIQKFPTHFMNKDIITSAQDMVGKSARRSITSNRPLRAHEITTPIVMKKNDIVQISYINQTMHISTTAQAMADGSAGDVIQFKNLNSNQLVRAQVNDARHASVQPFVQTSALEAHHANIH